MTPFRIFTGTFTRDLGKKFPCLSTEVHEKIPFRGKTRIQKQITSRACKQASTKPGVWQPKDGADTSESRCNPAGLYGVSLGQTSPPQPLLQLLSECFPGGSVANNPPPNAEDAGSIFESRRSPEEGSGNPLQYSSLGNPMDRAWWASPQGCKRVGQDQTVKQQHYYLVSFDCFPLFLHVLTSLIKLILQLKLFHRQKAGKGHGGQGPQSSAPFQFHSPMCYLINLVSPN